VSLGDHQMEVEAKAKATETQKAATGSEDQSGLRVGERGWWTSMLSTATAADVPAPDAPKEASFSLFSILPTPPPVTCSLLPSTARSRVQ
jgi:hypothetical protein